MIFTHSLSEEKRTQLMVFFCARAIRIVKIPISQCTGASGWVSRAPAPSSVHKFLRMTRLLSPPCWFHFPTPRPLESMPGGPFGRDSGLKR